MTDPAPLVDLTANLLLILLDALAVWALRRGRPIVPVALLWAVAAFLAGVGAAEVNGRGSFAVLRGLCWGALLHGPVLLIASAGWAWRGAGAGAGRWRAGLALTGLAGLLIAADAFLIEPRMLEVSRVPIPGLPARVALVADLQTDDVGAREAAVFARIRAEAPDLVLFSGDYVQTRTRPVEEESAELRALLAGMMADPGPRLGAYAVRGDVDWSGWEASFAGTGVVTSEETTRHELPGISLTLLSVEHSRSPRTRAKAPIQPAEQFHIVVGHAPDYALGDHPADLLLAGHTHGGQVQLPWIGPLITLSAVPRAWASGVTALPRGTLVVSRGIGMERGDAPRLRFLCRPELVILEPG